MSNCYQCNGSGRVFQPCSGCGGRGRKIDYSAQKNLAGLTCTSCGGTGRSSPVSCSACGGLGRTAEQAQPVITGTAPAASHGPFRSVRKGLATICAIAVGIPTAVAAYGKGGPFGAVFGLLFGALIGGFLGYMFHYLLLFAAVVAVGRWLQRFIE